MNRTILIAAFIIAIALSHAAPERMVIRIPSPEPQLLERFIREAADIASHKPGSYLDLVIGSDQLNRYLEEFPQLEITQTEAQLKSNLQSGRDIPGYHNYQQVVAELMQLQAQYPYLMQTSSLGTGWGAVYADQGYANYQSFDHELWAVKVSANAQAEEDEPAFFFAGEHHAREPLSTQVCLGILSHMVENYGTDPAVTHILDTSEIWIVPLLNPDGHKIVIDQTDVWWRKNIRDNNDSHSFNYDDWGAGYDGVDLNRNYGYYWGYTSATDSEYEATYHGPNPNSEPEVLAFQNLLQSKRFLAGISYHTYGEYVLYPYGYVSGITAPDYVELAALAFEIASLLPAQGGGINYDPGPSWGLYPVSGGLDDWAYGETGAFSYTIEMSTQFIPPAAQVPQIVQHQVNGALALLLRQDRKILRGHVTDALSGAPLEARILVEGLDDTAPHRAPIYSESQFGTYYYLLSPGQYYVHYIRPGYETHIQTVTISTMEPTYLDVALLPSQPYSLSIQIQGDYFEPLAGASLAIAELPAIDLVSDGQGNIVLSDFYPGEYQLIVFKPGYETLRLRRHIDSQSITLRITSEPVLTEDFEFSLSNWTTTGYWARTSSQSHAGSYSLTDSPNGNYQNNGTSSARLTAPLNLRNLDNADLQFQVRTTLSLDGDNLILETSPDGSNWNVLDFFEGSRDWTPCSYSLNSWLGGDLYLRFRMSTTGYGSADGVYIDDFRLFANADATETEDQLIPAPGVRISAGPNPFSSNSSITLKTSSHLGSAEVSVYNVKGRLVRRLGTKNLTKGTHSFEWDGRDDSGVETASGIYLVRVSGPAGSLASLRIAHIK